MQFKNPNLLRATTAYDKGVLNAQQYYNQLDLIYKANPTSFTEEEVDFIEKEFKKVDLPFNRDLEAADANLMSTVNQFVSGVVEGFTTLGWAEDPDTTAESIANKVGHLIGFAPDVVASVLSMGQYVPIATAKAISRKGAGAVSRGLQKAGQKAPPILRKEIGTDTFVLQSIPMKVADVVMDNVKSSLGRANVDTTGYLAKGIFANKRFRDIGEQSMHLGVAMAVSSWKDGPKAMADTAIHGAMAGALFGTIGNYVNVARLLGNPKTEKVGQQIVRGVAQKAYDTETQLRGINMAIKGAMGAGFQGGMATAQGLPVPEQIYEYLLGAFFGATARDRGYVERTKYINKNTEKFGDPAKPVDQVLKELTNDKEFLELPKYDQAYVKRHIAVVQQQIFNRASIIEGDAIALIKEIAKQEGIDLSKATQQQFENIKKKAQEAQLAEVLEDPIIEFRDDKPVPAERLTGITKIISGMQEGADYGGLLAAKNLGISTGGKVNKDFYGNLLKNPGDIAKEFGLTLTEVTGVKGLTDRTTQNIKDSDATILFTAGGRGSQRTLSEARRLNKKIFTLQAKEEYSRQDIINVRNFIQENPGVLNIAGSRDVKFRNSVQTFLENVITGKGLADTVTIKSMNKINKDMLNDLGIDFEGYMKTVDNKDLNEPVAINNDLRAMSDILRGYKIGRNKDEIIYELSKLADESNYEVQEFQKLFTAKYKDRIDTAKALQDLNVNRLGSYLKIRKNVIDRPELLLDLSTDGIKIINAPKVDINGVPINASRSENKYNQAFPRLDNRRARLVLRKSYVLEKYKTFGIKNIIDTNPSYKTESPLGFETKPLNKNELQALKAEQFRDYLGKKAIETMKKELAKKDAYIYGGAKDSGMLLIHKFPFTNKELTPTTQRRILKDLGLFGGKNLTPAQVKEYTSNIYYLLAESGYIRTDVPPTYDNMIKGMKDYIKNPLFDTVQKFNKYQNLAQGSDIQLESKEYVKLLQENKNVNLRTDGTFNFIQFRDFESSFVVNNERSVSATDAVVYARSDTFNTISTKNFRPALNGFLKLVGFKAPEGGVGNILLKTGTFKATEAMDKFMFDNNIHFIASESATKTQVGLKKHLLDYDPINNEWGFATQDKVLEPFKMKPEELYLNYGVYENYGKINKPVLIAKQMFDKINYEQLGTDAAEFRSAYEKLIQDSLGGKEKDNKAFEKAMAEDNGAFEIRDLNSVSMDLINEAISERGIRTRFGRRVLKKIIERGQEDYHNQIQEQGDKIDAERFGIETIDIPDVLSKVNYDVGAITYPPILSWINKSLANYRQTRLVKPTVQYGTEAKLGPADPEVAANLKDNQVKLGNTLRDKDIFVEGVGEMKLEKAWETFKPMRKNPTQHKLYNNYKDALTFLIMRNPNSGNGGVRVVEFAGFSGRDGIHAVTTSKTDYYLGGADKDADSIMLYQNMPNIFKKVFNKYESELFVGGKTQSFEKPEGTWKEQDLVVPYDTSPNSDLKVTSNNAKQSKKALEDLLTTDTRINVARNAKVGKVNIDFIVSSFNKMQVLADIIQQEGGSMTSKYVYEFFNKKKNKREVREKEVTITLKDDVKKLQLDNYIGVNLMADSSNFVKIAKFNEIQNTFFQKYFNISGAKVKGFTDAMNKIDSFKILKEIHNTVYIGEGQNKFNVVEKIANDYIDRYGAQNHYYYQLAKGMKAYSNFTINPYKYLFSENFQGFSGHEVAKQYTLALRERVINSKLLRRYGIEDSYRNDVESRASLEKLIADNNYDALHQKMIEYQGVHIGLELSAQLQREASRLSNGRFSDNTMRPIIQDVIDTTYKIKRLYDKDQLISLYGKNKKELSVENINNMIAALKTKYKTKFKNDKVISDRVEELIDTWLLATPVVGKDASKLQRKLILDIEGQNSIMRELEQSGKKGYSNFKKYQDSIKYKQDAIRSIQPFTPFMIKSIAINPKNREMFFKRLNSVLNKNAKVVSDRLLGDRNIEIEKLLNDNVIGDDRTFDIAKIKQALAENPDFKEFARIENDLLKYDYKGFNKKKKSGKQKPDTEKLSDKVLNAEELIGKILPQFDYIANQQNTRNKVITTEAQKELKRLRQILTKSPDAINRFEELFIDMTYRLEGVGRRLDTLTVQDLKSFNEGLEVLYAPKTAKEKNKYFERGPDWRDNTFNYSVVSKQLARVEQETEPLSRPILDKNGEMKMVRIEVPTSTLELARQTIDRFDTFQKVINPLIQDKIDGTFEYLDYNSRSLQEYRDLMFEAAVNKQEWNNGKYPTGSFDKVERDAIKKAWKDSERALNELNNEGVTIPLSTKTGEAIKERLKPTEFVERIRKDIDTLLKDIDKTFIKSRHTQLAKTMIQGYKLPGLRLTKDGNVLGKYKLSKTTDQGVKNMEQLFLQESGIIDTKKISILYRDLSNRNVSEREYISKYLPSINDYRFLKYHLEVKDRIQFLYPKIDLNKKLTGNNLKIIQKAVDKELYGYKGKRKDYFAKFQVGDIRQGYFPRNSHGSYKSEKPLLEQWQRDNIELQVKAAREDITKLPFQLQVELKFKRITEEAALLLYKQDLQANFERQMGNSLTAGQTKAERQIIDLMSRPNVDGFIGDYATGSTKSRGEQFMPYYKKDLDAIRYYTNGLFKMYFTNLAGLRTEVLLKKFDYVNKDKPYAREWSNYIRNAATNMMGLSTYRAYNIHGVRKQDQALFREFIEKGLDIDNMGPRKNYELDLLRDFDIAIQVKPAEQLLILQRNKGKISAAEKEINALKMKRAKELVEQVNTTGKYGSLYHYTSDEVAVGAFSRINKLFGGKIFGELPTNQRDRQYAIMSRIRNLSDLEGKFELLSLLSHPKTAITNLYGGVQNTISDTGWESFRRANDPAWMIKNLFDNGRAEFSFVDKVTGNVKTKKINSQERIYEWLESLGVYDQMFLDLISLDKNFGRQGYRKVFEEFIRRMNKSYAEGKITTEAIHNRESKKTIREVLRDSKIDIPITEFGALPMKWSERKLRGTAFLANYINMHQNVLGNKISEGIPFNSTVLTDYAMKGVQASQFMYQATFRPNFANTSLGRVLTRFQPYAWNSIGRRIRLFKDAQQAGWNREVLASKKFQRQFTFDLFALGLANIFVASIFEYALSPPMNWLQDTSALLFGDAKDRERAFFSSYPHPVLAPLQVVTPPIGRFVLSPMTAILNGDWENFSKYQLATYFPFGRLYRDAKRTYESPAMAVDFMTGLPLHQVHTLRRNQIEEQKELELQNDLDDMLED